MFSLENKKDISTRHHENMQNRFDHLFLSNGFSWETSMWEFSFFCLRSPCEGWKDTAKELKGKREMGHIALEQSGDFSPCVHMPWTKIYHLSPPPA